MKQHLSKRGQSLSKNIPLLARTFFDIVKDLYDPVRNPNGYISMGTAETYLINDEVVTLIKKVQDSLPLNSAHMHYDFFHGSEEFRSEIARYWQHLIFKGNNNVTLTKDNVVVSAGCSLILEMLAMVLGDPGDVFLIPAPYYSSFEDDINIRAHIEPVPVHSGPELNIKAFEEVLEQQKEKGKQVKAVLLSSPNNPVGTVYAKESLQNIISFCMDHDLDLISDEIYAQTVFDANATWCSMLSLVPDHYLHRVHIAASFAKDFALSGLKTGFAISLNDDLIKGLQNLAIFSPVSTHTQALLTELLKSPDIPALIQKNQEKLRQSYHLMKTSLDDMAIESRPAQGGIFLFADLSKYLSAPTFDAEFVLWKKILDELKINISPGNAFRAENPGWFRICYAHDMNTVEEACRRLKTL